MQVHPWAALIGHTRNCVLTGRGGELPCQGCCSEHEGMPSPQSQAQVLVLRLSTGAGRCVFSIGDDQCTCTFDVVTQELELPLLGCTDCISLALLLILPYSAHIKAFYKKLLFFCVGCCSLYEQVP